MYKKILKFHHNNWTLLNNYGKEHFCIRALRVGAGEEVKFYLDYLESQLPVFTDRIDFALDAFDNVSKAEVYTKELVQGRLSTQSNKRLAFFTSHPQYLPLNYVLWDAYQLWQVGRQLPESVSHLDIDTAVRYLQSIEVEILDTFASKFLNNLAALKFIWGVDYSIDLQAAKRELIDMMLHESQSDSLINNYYYFTHIFINESGFYTQYSPYVMNDEILLEKLSTISEKIANHDELKPLKKLDMLIEMYLALYLTRSTSSHLYPDIQLRIEGLLADLDHDQLFDPEFISVNEHTSALILLFEYAKKNTDQNEKPYLDIHM